MPTTAARVNPKASGARPQAGGAARPQAARRPAPKARARRGSESENAAPNGQYTEGVYANRAAKAPAARKPPVAKPPGFKKIASPAPAPAPTRPKKRVAQAPAPSRPKPVQAPAPARPKPKPIARPVKEAPAPAPRASPITTRSATTNSPITTKTTRDVRLGRSIVVEPVQGPAVCSILLLHGFACDAKQCASSWKPRLKSMGDLGTRCRLVFLNAPKREISCYPGETPVESAWHDYFTDHGGAGGRPEIEEDIDQNHLAEARKLIHAEIDKEAEKFGGDYRRVALFGESQGGCTALDAATTHPKTIGGVFCSFGQLYSCTPISARSARDLKIVFWHGSRDKTIAASLCLRSAARLLDRGAKKLTLHIEDGLEHCQGSDSEAQCLRKSLENWGFLSGQPETAPEPKSSPVRREPPPTPPSIIKPPGLTPPPRPPRSERATPDPTPPGFARQSISRDSVEEDVRALISSSDRDEVAVSHISGLYRRKYGRMLDYKSLGFAKLTAFVAEIPGLELMNGAAGGSVRLAQAAPHRMIYDDETDSELEGYA
mmetsp:Transcript_6103/g.15579  ORF Transcript_6103/g.15579 Transcript_6103/m.15579 type:complete len:546 (+) Transcript_6103:158-1795(+)